MSAIFAKLFQKRFRFRASIIFSVGSVLFSLLAFYCNKQMQVISKTALSFDNVKIFKFYFEFLATGWLFLIRGCFLAKCAFPHWCLTPVSKFHTGSRCTIFLSIMTSPTIKPLHFQLISLVLTYVVIMLQFGHSPGGCFNWRIINRTMSYVISRWLVANIQKTAKQRLFSTPQTVNCDEWASS